MQNVASAYSPGHTIGTTNTYPSLSGIAPKATTTLSNPVDRWRIMLLVTLTTNLSHDYNTLSLGHGGHDRDRERERECNRE